MAGPLPDWGSILDPSVLHGVEDIAQVKRACIEPSGMISVLRKDGGEVEAPEPQAAL